MVPAARALSRTFASAAVFFSISAHCARGIAQFPTYEYIGAFSLTSDICACADPTTTVKASVHTPAKIPLNCLLMFSPNTRRRPGFLLASWATQVYMNVESWRV